MQHDSGGDLIHKLLVAMQVQVTELVGDVKSIKSTVDRIEPLVDTHEARNNQAKGAFHLGSGIWKLAASGGMGAAVATVIQIFAGSHTSPHP